MPTSKQRREAERRRLQRQLQRRTQREARRRRLLMIGSIVGTLAVVAIVIGFVVMTGDDDKTPKAGGGSTSASPSPSSSSTSAAPVAAYPCTWKKSGTAAKKVNVPPTTKPPRTGTVNVAVTTSQGAMTFTLNRAAAPCAVENFVSLAGQHYYDATPCHRLTSGTLSVLQCGDPTGKGSGGPGYSFNDELTGKEKYTRGELAMANAGPNTNGSQFFIVYKDSQLTANYTVFGSVSKGLGVVDKVAAKGSNPAGDGAPKLPVKLTKVSVAK
jgi:peptidyl-prolyl cis-trans isomerase B (cyclophilin B)